MEYTKGEWKDWITTTGERIIYVQNEDGIEVICRDIRHFNAPIVKAAPAMYKALSGALADLDSIDELCKIAGVHPYTRLRLDTEQALAKAEGGKGNG